MTEARTYPDGVPCWIDTEQPDLGAARHFYGELFGWAFEDAMPPGGPGSYLIARLDGRDVAAPACADRSGARFRLWEARRRLGAQLVNAPGAWNFSDLHTADPDAAAAFYPPIFGWAVEDLGFATMIRRPGYGDHLAETVDPGIRDRQADVAAPPGFEDAIAWLAAAAPGEPDHWHVSLSVGDRDAAAVTAERLGAEIRASEDSDWTRTALLRDPQGAELTLSQFTPPEAGPSD